VLTSKMDIIVRFTNKKALKIKVETAGEHMDVIYTDTKGNPGILISEEEASELSAIFLSIGKSLELLTEESKQGNYIFDMKNHAEEPVVTSFNSYKKGKKK